MSLNINYRRKHLNKLYSPGEQTVFEVLSDFTGSSFVYCCSSLFQSFQESSESAAGQLLSNCVSEGVVTEVSEVASLQDSVLSSHLYETDKHVKATQELDQVWCFQTVELLRLEQKSADVAHRFHLSEFGLSSPLIQMFNEHLQQVLKNHKKLRERLMQPVTGNKLPIPSHLHRYTSVVEVFDLMLEFIVNLEDKLSSTHAQESINEHQSLLVSHMT
uniref:Uncharacterized protein n=1 Tax=Salarias fasciatus TaxID=181472 RepID=A0A672I8A2_SALFA